MTKKKNLPDPPNPKDLLPHEERPYRPGIGIVLFNPQGLVFVAERLEMQGSWQMPQGGIDDGEAPEDAVLREMEEEIGTKNARILEVMDDWLFYDIPAHTANKLWNGKYRGQKQKWVALEFTGVDSDIDLKKHSHPEFGQWKWIEIEDLLDYVVSFKREVYERVMEQFSSYADELKYNYEKNNKGS